MINESPLLSFDLNNPATFYDLGWDLLYGPDRVADPARDAARAFEIALELDPDRVEYLLELAVAYGLSGRDADEVATLERAISLAKNPKNLAEAHLRLGITYDGLGKDSLAKSELAILQQLDPQRATLLERVMLDGM
ncbi:MAG: hypothetical protein NTW14_07265 [bacterium]|nr:hypothetical protein [bacterium]